jgi:hypothetical protein
MPPAMKEDDRSFYIEDSSIGYGMRGRYVGQQPFTSGRKAARFIFRLVDKPGSEYSRFAGITEVVVRMQEMTQMPGANHGHYTYRVTRTRKTSAKKRVFGKNAFTPMWDYYVEAVDDEELGKAKLILSRMATTQGQRATTAKASKSTSMSKSTGTRTSTSMSKSTSVSKSMSRSQRSKVDLGRFIQQPSPPSPAAATG